MTSTAAVRDDSARDDTSPALGVAGAVTALASGAPTNMTEAERVAALREIMGARDVAVTPFPEAIRAVTFRNHDRWVKPLYEAHWPEALSGSTAKKLRFLSCNLYATAPYTVLFTSPRPPLVVRVMRGIGTGLGLEKRSLASLAAVGVRFVDKLLDEDTHRRISLIAAFIAVVDHVFDHCMGNLSAEERGKRMRGVLDGSWVPPPVGMDDVDGANAGAFRFLRALYVAMSSHIEGEDAAVWDVASKRIFEFVDSEVKAMTGVPDPTGCCWRMAGVLGTIDGLFFPVWRWAAATGDPLHNKARDWMYSVSLFVQVMDDWIDLDSDAKGIRPTPVMTGFWNLETVKETWDKTYSGIVELARDSGGDDEAWLGFVAETYRMMALEVMEAMCKGSAA